ncbi:MAG: repeat-containing protein YrrB, partial [Verrucomicrobiota bacterium]
MTTCAPQAPAPAPAPSRPPARPWLWVAVAAAVLLPYAGALHGPLLMDDLPAITENPSIRRLWPPGAVLSPPADSPTAGRPLVNLTFAINHAISGTAPWSYHLVNVAIHVAATLALGGVLRRTLRGPALGPRWGADADGLAATIALLWGVHPLCTQTVSYLSQRSESLMALFFLLTLYGFVRGLEGRTRWWHAAAVAACALGALSKEIIVAAPLIVWLYDRTFVAGSFRAALGRRRIFYAGLAATWLLTAWLLIDVKRRGVGFGIGLSSWHYALTQCKAVTLYLRLSVWPHPLIFDYGSPIITSIGGAWPYALMLAGTIAAAAWAWVRSPGVGFAAAWFFVLLAPASSVVPVVGATMAENRVYLPLAGVVALVVLAVHRLARRAVARGICAVVIVAATVATVRRNRDFQSVLGLWTDTVAKLPISPRAHNNLAVALAEDPARRSEAGAHYLTALRLWPDYADAHKNLALLLSTMPGREATALESYAAALRLKPELGDAHLGVAALLAAEPNRQTEAIRHYAEALRLKPAHAEAHNNLAALLAREPDGRADALRHYEEALRLKPDYAEAHANLANLLATIPGRQAEALSRYAEALRLKPDFAAGHYNLAALLATLPDRQEEARTHYAEALRLDPAHAEAHNNLASLLAPLPGREAEAAEHFATALRLKPEFVGAHFNFARLLAAQPERRAEALDHYAEALRLKPDYAEAHHERANLLGAMPGRQADAAHHYAEALRLRPDLAEAHNNLALLLGAMP